MNIAHIQLSGGPGGIVILTRDINRYSKHKNLFYFVFEGGSIAEEIIRDGAQVEIANESHGISAYIKGAKKFVSWCKKNKVDLIISHSGGLIARLYLLYAKKQLKSIKTIVYLHSNADSGYSKKGIKARLSDVVLKQAHKKSDLSIAISNSVRDSFIKLYGFDPNKTFTVYNGTDTNKFYHIDEQHDVMQLIYVGRLFYDKGPDLLINAMNLLDDKTNVHLTFVGGNMYADYDKQMQDLTTKLSLNDKITFAGFSNDVASYLAKSDLFVHPARWQEGFGIALIEAFSSSVPCLAYNRGAIPEIIDDGKNGFIVDELSSEALAKQIDECYKIFKTEKYEKIRENAKQSSIKFDIKQKVEELEDYYL